MKPIKNQQNHQDILAAALTEAWKNEDFKAELIKAPRKAIAVLTGKDVDLWQGKTMVVTDQTDSNTFYFNIPAEPNSEDLELTEKELEHVAGGGATDIVAKAKKAYAIAKAILDFL